ncbi:hypothetical protein A4D02_23265 [Niastella koreensis]|uniref:Putative zinc ribbon domain-containing protein n=2 Tax=Niastella koreensis TaxID=354356 RepID=G8TBU8_NIAKG|nr:zinc ribbon domain-containing protein [Niastella koreensis]AEV98230.1 hypothetical protein Niako_1872 [Niastella koreensis GR20-10]OQP53311.1 hypothetical protein A4D02_23265 [Niastella koreensis]
MSGKYYCQSCSLPMDSPELFGTEKDGTRNNDYCKYCYANGEFTNPDLTLDEMIEHMMKRMENDRLPQDVIEVAISRLPFLKRWSSNITAV